MPDATFWLIALLVLLGSFVAWMVLVMVLIQNLHRRLVRLSALVSALAPTRTPPGEF